MSIAENSSSTFSDDDSNYIVGSTEFEDASEFEDAPPPSSLDMSKRWEREVVKVQQTMFSPIHAIESNRGNFNRQQINTSERVSSATEIVSKETLKMRAKTESVSEASETDQTKFIGPIGHGKAGMNPALARTSAASETNVHRGHRRRQGSFAGMLDRISGPASESAPSLGNRRTGSIGGASDLSASRRMNYSPSVWLKQAMNPNASDPTFVQSFKKNKGRREFNHVHLLQEIQAHVGAIWTSEISPCGRYFLSAGKDLKINLYRIAAAEDGSNNVLHHLCTYEGHQGDILCLSWSSNSTVFLSSSMDKTVRLWKLPSQSKAPSMHVRLVHEHTRFEHSDFVTGVAFHPNNEWFVTACFDKKLRVWSIREKSVLFWVDLSSFITCVTLAAEGRLVIVGDHEGKATFFDTEGLRWVTQIHVRSRRGRNSKGKKISGIRVMPDQESILITSNDSRVRLFRLSDFGLICKYKGTTNDNFQIVARPSATGEYIICGSEANNCIVWNTLKRNEGLSFSLHRQKFTERKDRNRSYEFWRCSDAAVTVAMFLPPESLKLVYQNSQEIASEADMPMMVISCDETGKLLVFENKKRMRRHATVARGYMRGSTRGASTSPASSHGGLESPSTSPRAATPTAQMFAVSGGAKVAQGERRLPHNGKRLSSTNKGKVDLEDSSDDYSL